MIPAKADPDEQAAYLHKVIQPRLDEAQAAQRAVFFVDAAHFVLAPFLGFLWSVTRLFIKAPSGRQRFNILGALNAITHELISVTNDTYITSKEVCELLHKLAALPLGVPITLFLDNARYQKCQRHSSDEQKRVPVEHQSSSSIPSSREHVCGNLQSSRKRTPAGPVAN